MQFRTLLGGALLVLLPVGVTFAQQPTTNPQQGDTSQPAEADQPAPGEEPPAVEPEVPEGIELTEGSGYQYESGGRRDPFVSLAQGVAILPEGPRPAGLPGMLIQEVSLRGIVKTSDGYIAMIQGTDNKSYFAKLGERLYDGSIETIDDEKVVFRQEINDPLRIERFQRVEKSLHPVEEQR